MIGWEELITCSTSEGHLSKPIINLQKMPCTEVIDLLIFFFKLKRIRYSNIYCLHL